MCHAIGVLGARADFFCSLCAAPRKGILFFLWCVELTMIDTLPDELLCAIFGHLPCLALRSAVPLVCRRWRDVAGDTMALQVRLCIDAARTMKRPARWCDAAAAAGHLHCLAHARYDIGLAWGATTCQSSSRAGHLDCLQFAHSNGCPWNHNTTRVAAANGHLDCFLYAIENQCPIQDEAMLAAARNGHADILDVIASETDDTVLDLRVCERAAVGGHLDLIQQLGRWHTVADGTALYGAVCAGHVAITRYLVEEHGLRHCPWDCGARSSQAMSTLCVVFATHSDLVTRAISTQRRPTAKRGWFSICSVAAYQWTTRLPKESSSAAGQM